MEKENFFGVDFGTTNTALVHFSKYHGKMFIGDQNNTERPLPSVVAINIKSGKITVGKEVKDNLSSYETDDCKVVFSVKTILNQDKITDKNGQPIVINGKTLTPIDIASEIFKNLKETTTKKNLSMDEIVLSVPINFSASKKNCLITAAKNAGIKVTKFVSEPTAAFISHYTELQAFKNIIVFDWGGGTLDISALNLENGAIREVYTANLYKAGDDIDKAFARNVYEKQIRKYGLSLIPIEKLDSREYDDLLTKTETAKIELSRKDTVKDIVQLQGAPKIVEFSYNDLKLSAEPFIDTAIDLLTHVITKAFKNELPSCILCVGGSSKLRLLQEKLKKLFDARLYFPENPEWDIADGACVIDASPMEKNIYTLANDIKLQLSDGNTITLLSDGQPLPCKSVTVNLSTIDCSEKANFIITCKKDEKLCATLPVLGGIDEVLVLYAYVDPCFILHIDVENKKTNESYNILNCESIELRYNL